jgi:selenocysteine lyase/cysteine desulfurase
MILSDHKIHYSRFLKLHEGKLHFAAHSHHFWPDVTREAQLKYWDDTAQLSDEKWNKIFSEVIPKTQGHIAEILNLKDKNQIVLAPNTHELTTRLLSLFLGKSEINILTTESEFHSWRRQILRLMELPQVKVTMVNTSDKTKMLSKLKSELKKKPDVFFISQVFFDSGLALSTGELEDLQKEVVGNTLMVVDGYHGFAAVPTDLSRLEGKIFYLAGGYKYGQGGEGVGFMVVPKGQWRPAYTGWYADYAHLSKPAGANVGYAENAMAFMGATQDSSGFYRFNASWDLFKKENLSVVKIHEYVLKLQTEFIRNLPQAFFDGRSLKPLYEPELSHHGHFLTYEADHEEAAEKIHQTLRDQDIIIDRRGKRLRFGFGIYQNLKDVQELCERLKKLA